MPVAQYTTAVYPNRISDKWNVETSLGLGEHGDEQREFRPDQIRVDLQPKFNRPLPPDAYCEWLEPVDCTHVKVYAQKRDVKHIRNAPAGAFAGKRAEGYADYRPGIMVIRKTLLVEARADPQILLQ